MIQLLQNRVAIIASHSEPVAQHVAQLFLRHGANVVLVGKSPAYTDADPEFADRSRWMSLPVDMTDPTEARYCVAKTLSCFDRADVLFYHPNAEATAFSSSSSIPNEQAMLAYVKNLWWELVDTMPMLPASGRSNVVIAADTASDTELTSVETLQTENYRVSIDLINTMQVYYPKRQQQHTACKQLTPERIARLTLSLMIKDKQEEAEWNEVLNWSSEYLDAAS